MPDGTAVAAAAPLSPPSPPPPPPSLLPQRAVPGTRGTIAVALNEAALDSPSFRAAAQHMFDQVDAIEKWLEAYIKASSKMAADFLSMEDTINAYLVRMVPPPGAADSVIDHDYTYLALKRVGEGAREWWTDVTTMIRRVEAIVVEPVRTFLTADLRAFKEARRTLETAQKTYDQSLSRYVAQSKTKEPSALREDAFAVFEARKSYIKASLEYCRLTPQLRFNLDKVLIAVNSNFWTEMRRARDQPSVSRWNNEMDRIRGWSKEMEASEGVFRLEVLRVQRDISERAVRAATPVRELDEYSTSTVPFLGGPGSGSGMRRKGGKPVASEKQGWLFLKRVSASKPVRTSWTRRWYYCRDGVFGWLIQGPHGVLQGDEIGVLLCNAKPAVSEDRRFCFEVKTGAQTMMLQAETQAELMGWLDVFDVSRQVAFEATEARTASSPGQADPAFSISPPSVPELSAKTLDAHLSSLEDIAAPERSATLPVPAAGDLSRVSIDVNAAGPRRGLAAALGRDFAREEGESSREHATRIIQNLNLHRKAATAAGADGAVPGGGGGIGPAGLANLATASHNLLPVYTTPGLAAPSSMRAGFPAIPAVDTPRGSLAPNTLAKPPVPTLLSRTAVVATAERGLSKDKAHSMPASVMANYWGSNLWGGLLSSSKVAHPPNRPGGDEGDPIGVVVSEGGKASASAAAASKVGSQGHPGAERFPPGYPQELKAQHAQFRILFPKVPDDEKLVLVFRAAWSVAGAGWPSQRPLGGGVERTDTAADALPREEERTSVTGRVYATSDNLYFYGYHMGLVSTGGISLDSVTEVTTLKGTDRDLIRLHLRHDDGNSMRTSLLTIHTFLDDFGLLINRLNLLIDDLQSEEPMDLQDLVAALAGMGKDDGGRRSPSADSWEEGDAHAPFDGGTHRGRAAARLSRSPVETRHRHRPSKQPQQAKFALPLAPVVYVPDDMGDVVAERHFEISAKACFHVLFGDKSFVFPKLYFERLAQQITQGPWKEMENGHGRREFRFLVDVADMLNRSNKTEVVDSQTIEVFSDHVTYVVTHTKTAWHLPHSQLLRFVFKIVITHVAKSKCKLAIYARVHWTKTPKFSKWLVENQALNDARADAEELAEVATDQVHKLGPHSRTKRAIQVYGLVGQQDQAIQFSPAESRAGASAKKQPAVKTRTLTAMIFDTLRSFAESVVTSVMMWAFAALRNLFKVLTAHRLIVLGLMASVLFNVFMTSKDSWGWWKERRAAQFMNRLGVGPNHIMSRAIYLADLEEATGTATPTFPSNSSYPRWDSECFVTYQTLVNSTDIDAPANDTGTALALSSAASRATAGRLRRTRQRMGTYRHNLVVGMRMVNRIEREVIRAEWENWLGDEMLRCERLRVMLEDRDSRGLRKSINKSKDKDKSGGKSRKLKDKSSDRDQAAGDTDADAGGGDAEQERAKIEALRQWHKSYCGSCSADMSALTANRAAGEGWV